MVLNPASPVPLYRQFKQLIERKIAANEWPPGSPIPPELTLIREYAISRTTVRQALDELVKEGRIYRQRGRGTFVAPPRFAQPLAHLAGFAEELSLRGLAPAIEVLVHRLLPAPPHVAACLQVAPGSDVLYIRRVVSEGGAPLFVDDSYFPAELAGLLRVEQIQAQPIYQLLEAAGRGPAEGDQWLEAVEIPEALAPLLDCGTGTPGLSITRVTKDPSGVPLEFASAVYRGDRYRYAIRLKRGQRPPSHFA